MKKAFRFLSLLLVMVMLTSMFIGCGKDGDEDKVDADKQQDEQKDKEKDKDPDKKPDDEKEKQDDESSTLITDKPVKLTYWMRPHAHALATHDNLGDTPFAKREQELTGVEIEYLHPAEGKHNEQFNLMVSTGNLPDILEWNFFNYPGGQGKAVEDEVIIDLTDLINEHAPNFKKLLEEDPIRDKLVKTDDGLYTIFTFMRGKESPLISMGPIFRKDWLDDLGLEVPDTIDDWYNVLQKFKVEKDSEAPFLGNNHHYLTSAFGITHGFYPEDGEIKYGPAEPGFREYLETLAKWYAEGLIHPEYNGLNSETRDALCMNGGTGAFIGAGGAGLRQYLEQMADKDPNYDLAGAPYPASAKGERGFHNARTFPVVAPCFGITPNCEEPEIATKWLDFGYSGDGVGVGGEGYMLYTYGIEGETYEIIDGIPRFTELITDHPDGLVMNQAKSIYVRSAYSGPMVQGSEYLILPEDRQQINDKRLAAISRWLEADDSHRMPPLTLTPEEDERYQAIISEIDPYMKEMREKFVKGEESLQKYDEYIDNIEKMGIKEALEIQNAAYKRFENR